MTLNLRLLIAATCLTHCWGVIYDRVSDLPRLDYDFVIIGGGTAGNVLANRLTENPTFNVLVLEAGVSNEGVLDSMIPMLFNNLAGDTPYNWNFTTTPQQGLNGRSIAFPRGHILGGSSSISEGGWFRIHHLHAVNLSTINLTDGMIYTRGSSDDFDRFANITGDPGWSWDNIQKYIRRNERWVEPADHHDTRGQFDPSVHSTSGINFVSLPGFPQGIDHRVIQTTTELSDEFPFILDMNAGRPLGVGWTPTTIGGGMRSSSATSYLGPHFINRRNLQVLLHARVTRVIPTHFKGSRLAFNAVEFVQDIGGRKFKVQASKEVILSAGVIGTPHILLHSGIGDKAALTALGIKPLHHLPSVGQNLSEHPMLYNAWFVNSTDTFEAFTGNATRFEELLRLWNETHTGPFVDVLSKHIAWLRLPPDATVFQEFEDPAAGRNTPHIELFIENGAFNIPPAAGEHFLTIITFVLTPVGRGSVTLSSTNPFDPPLIDLGLLTSDFDLFAMRTAIKRAQRFLSAPVWKDYVIKPTDNLANARTDSELDQYIRNNTVSGVHSVGSASMSAKDATGGVVNPNLLVKGVSGLRIVDASVMPFVTCGHTQAPTYAIAERAADLIKQTWGQCDWFENIYS